MSQAFSLEPQSEAWFLLIPELNQFKNCLFHLASNMDFHWNVRLSHTSLGIFRRIAGGVFPCPHLPGASLDRMSSSKYIKTPLAGLRCLCCWCGSFGQFTEMLLWTLLYGHPWGLCRSLLICPDHVVYTFPKLWDLFWVSVQTSPSFWWLDS